MIQILQLCSQIFKNSVVMFWNIIINIFLIYVWIITFNHQAEGAPDDFGQYAAVIVVSMVTLVIFTFIDRQNVLANVTKNLQIFEFESYKEMFNSLHEGIIVINAPETLDKNESDQISIFFANEIIQLIMQQLLGITADKK